MLSDGTHGENQADERFPRILISLRTFMVIPPSPTENSVKIGRTATGTTYMLRTTQRDPVLCVKSEQAAVWQQAYAQNGGGQELLKSPAKRRFKGANAFRAHAAPWQTPQQHTSGRRRSTRSNRRLCITRNGLLGFIFHQRMP